MNQKNRRCPCCGQGTLEPATRVREFLPQGRKVVVELLTSRCAKCGNESTSAAQHSENLQRLAARKAQYGGQLLGEEILALRRRYAMTQLQAAKLFGKGKIAFSRYENEVTYPDESTTRLLQLAIEKPDVVGWLAERSGVELPLWQSRCEQERKAKVRLLTQVRKVDAQVNPWAHPPAGALAQHAVGEEILKKWMTGAMDHPRAQSTANDSVYTLGVA